MLPLENTCSGNQYNIQRRTNDVTVKLTALQMIRLDNFLGEAPTGKRGEAMPVFLLRRKILSDEARERFLEELPDGREVMRGMEIRAAEPVEVEFTKEEIRRVMKIVDAIEPANKVWDWLLPILEQLEASAPAAKA